VSAKRQRGAKRAAAKKPQHGRTPAHKAAQRSRAEERPAGQTAAAPSSSRLRDAQAIRQLRAFDGSASLASSLASTPEVILEGESAEVLGESTELRAITVDLPSVGVTYAFESELYESEQPEQGEPQWNVIQESSETVATVNGLTSGIYNFRVTAKVEGREYRSEISDRLVTVNGPSLVKLGELSAELRRTVTLQATVPQSPSAATASQVTFELELTGSRPGNAAWQKIGSPITVPASSKPGRFLAKTTLDTAGLPDGDYSFRAVPEYEPESGEGPLVAWETIPQRGVLIDNTAPTVTLLSPGSPLSGPVQLEARAGDPAPQTGEPSAGVAAVRFQVRPETSTGTWATVGTTTHSGASSTQYPVATEAYARELDVDALANGAYELRAIAEDRVGNVTVSAPVRAIGIAHGSTAPAVSASLSGVTAPASEVHFLGTIPASSGREAETLAYGFTGAPPAEVNGHQLEYTAEGKQPVLLRYTDAEGWQIAGVLEREAPGGATSAFKLLARSETGIPGGVQISGAMTPSGEGWLSLAERSSTGTEVVGLFHRKPGSDHPFVYDEAATTALRPLLAFTSPPKPVAVRLGQSSNGQAYGMLIAPGQPEEDEEEPASSKEMLKERIRYGLLSQEKWTLETATLPAELERAASPVTLALGDLSGPGEGWGAFEPSEQAGHGLIVGRLKGGVWKFAPTGNPALDLTGPDEDALGTVKPVALKAQGDAVWVEASLTLPPEQAEPTHVVALLKEVAGPSFELTASRSWCSIAGPPAVEWGSCDEPLGSAAVPQAIFEPEVDGHRETVALALHEAGGSFLDVFEHGEWRGVLTPGYGSAAADPSEVDFSSPNEGWVAGAKALGAWSAEKSSSSLTSWPLPDRAPLMSVALPPGTSGAASESGAVTVGFKGTALSYEPALGWQVDPVPARAHHVNLLSVAFAAPGSAFAVGQFGTILRWNGSSWSEDPQSGDVTASQLNAVAFAPGAGGSTPVEGFAVGAAGTILHYNGQTWTPEEPPEEDAGVNITSVAMAGSEAFAIAGGELITHRPGQPWEPALCGLRSGAAVSATCSEKWGGGAEPPEEALRQVAALPDGGAVLAGRSVELFREAAGEPFKEAPQPLQGIAVALAPYRNGAGKLRTYISIAPPGRDAVNGSPVGDGELLSETEGGWKDLSRSQYAGNSIEGDGAVKNDPVLALATGASGEHAWAVGGYDGTEDAAGQGTEEPVSSRPETWQTASVWHYDSGTSESPSASATTGAPALSATPGTVSFAFFTSPMCKVECSAVTDAQPDVNLHSAASEIAAFAAQEGGPAFAMLGGNAVGPEEGAPFAEGVSAVQDFSHLSEQLAPLSNLPTFAAAGAFDRVPKQPGNDELRPWAEAFSGAPPPFGSGPSAANIAPAGPTGAVENEVHRYYSFNASQNGGTVRVIVLDDSKAGAFDNAQREWLERQLAGAGAEGLSVVVMAATPLRRVVGDDLESVAELLTEQRWNGEVLAVFSTDGSATGSPFASEIHERNEKHLIPELRAEVPEEHREGEVIPEYEGATLGYQQAANNGVTWYLASVNTTERAVKVSAIPVLESLNLKAVDGLTAARGNTLQFEAIARRPPSTLATKATETSSAFEGYDQYVQIPPSGCGGRPCIQPSYKFTSNPTTVGQFVEASAPGSPYPKLNPANGRAYASSTSGLFCGYNPGTTVVTITAGLLSYSETVTVEAGAVGPTCGKEPLPPKKEKRVTKTTQAPSHAGAGAPAAPPTALSGVNPTITALPPPPVAPAPVAKPSPVPPLAEPAPITPAIVPATTPPVEPIPPGSGGYAQSPSAAERREKARKHASQSAFVIRPAGTSGEEWFYGAVAIGGLLVALLTAGGLRGGSRGRPAPAFDRTPVDRRRRERR
jgi:hypothetical protein